MSLIRANLLANFAGQAWRMLMGLAFIPIYIRYLGMEAYGLIAVFAILIAWLELLDIGMKPALGREMARFSGGAHTAQSIYDLLRSIEIVAAFLGLLIALIVWLASDWLAENWLSPRDISVDVIAESFRIMGLVAALRFLENIYVSAVSGLQLQVLQNVLSSIAATCRGLGAVIILVCVSPTIQAFFLWQAVISISSVVAFSVAVYGHLPRTQAPAQFSLGALGAIARFAGGMTTIAFLSLLLTQADKILLSQLLSLEEFGHYALAGVVASAVYMLAAPIGATFSPRFAQLAVRGESPALQSAYHTACQLVSVCVGAAAVTLITYSDQILLLWTANVEISEKASSLLAVLTLGSFLNSLMWVPYQMQLAYGWTSLMVRTNSVAVLLLVPSLLWIAPRYGAFGAAWAWVMLNLGYVTVVIGIMHWRIMPSQKCQWYVSDVLLPVGAALVAAIGFRELTPEMGKTGQIISLTLSTLVTLTAAVVAAPTVRRLLLAALSRHLRPPL